MSEETNTDQDLGSDVDNSSQGEDLGNGGGGEDKQLTLTQKELNSLLANNRRNLTKKNEEMVQRLEQMQKTLKMTQAQREELEATIENLRSQTMSQEELAKRESKKQQQKYENEIKTLSEQLGQWKNLYTSETINRALMDAGSTAGAYNPEQIVRILGPSTRFVEVQDEETGETSRKVLVTYDHTDDDGKTKKLEIEPGEAIKLMKESDRYANLFVAKGSPGLGQSGNTGREEGPPKDIDGYLAWRSRNKDKLGLR